MKEKAKGLRELEAEDASKEAMPFSGEGLMRIKAHKDDAQVKFKPKEEADTNPTPNQEAIYN